MKDLKCKKPIFPQVDWDYIFREPEDILQINENTVLNEVHEWTKPDVEDLEKYDVMFSQIYGELHDGLTSIIE
jgi:hypothetical protein